MVNFFDLKSYLDFETSMVGISILIKTTDYLSSHFNLKDFKNLI